MEDCEQAMGLLAAATTSLAVAEGLRDAEVALAREKHAVAISACTEEIKELTAQLQHYYMAHLGEIERDGKKSVELRHGVMGRRMSPPALKLLSKAWTWASAAVRVLDVFGVKYLRVSDPEIDKEAIKQAGIAAEDLRLCGLKITQDEDFFAEPRVEAE
jgi:phage host-nuclease inhibitor protein Gam